MQTKLKREKKKAVTIMMPPYLIEQARETARVLDVSMNQVFRMAVFKYLAEKSSRNQPMF